MSNWKLPFPSPNLTRLRRSLRDAEDAAERLVAEGAPGVEPHAVFSVLATLHLLRLLVDDRQ
jgi:hypothetical protein